ncbi:MAG: RNA 2',3'-cyclic phosphodiesterase [Chloroflexota bacterium]|jgi:2'-5' RNA ligase
MLIRAFIAIELSAMIHSELGQLVGLLRKSGLNGIRWVNPSNIHLTLRFLGDTLPESLQQVSVALSAATRRIAPFEIQVRGVGAFPNFNRPRVVWAGVQAPPELINLQQSIETMARKTGFPAEERPFSPHLTLGRVQRAISPADLARLSQGLASLSVGLLGNMLVSRYVLFQSDLKPSGAVYTRLACFDLTG